MNAIQAPANQGPLPHAPERIEGCDEPSPPRWQQWLQGKGLTRVYIVAFTLLFCQSLSRTLRMPNGYAKGHWLHNYKHGFVPRGLVGEILYPLFQNKNPQELNGILAFLGWGVLALLCGWIVYGAWRLLNTQHDPTKKTICAAVLLMFATSSYPVFAGHLAGYFDHLIHLAAGLSVMAIVSRRYLVAGLLSSLAILTHEMYVVGVMPAVFFAALLFLWGESTRTKTRAFLALLVPPIATFLVVAGKGFASSNVSELTQQIAAYGVVDSPATSTVHLSEGMSTLLGDMFRSTLGRVIRPDGFQMIGPPLLAMLLFGCSIPIRSKPWPLRVLFILTSFAPFLMLLTIWNSDTGRMSAQALFSTFCSLVALAYWQARRGEKDGDCPQSGPVRAKGLLVALLGLAGAIFQMTVEVPLMDQEEDGESVFSIRRAKSVEGYECGQLLFENSGFEQGSLKGWIPQGAAFRDQPVDRQPAMWLRRPGNERKYWIGTYDRRSLRGYPMTQGDQPRGSLLSEPFVITKSCMNFLVGGGRRLDLSYVTLEIDGRERFRTTGEEKTQMRRVVWDLEPYYGHSARIRIVDNDSGSWGHIMADGFCYCAKPQRNALGSGG